MDAQFYVTKKLDYPAAAKEYLEILKLEPENVQADARARIDLQQGRQGQAGFEEGHRPARQDDEEEPQERGGVAAARRALPGCERRQELEGGDRPGREARPVECGRPVDGVQPRAQEDRDGDISAKQDALEAARKIKLYDRHKGTDEYKGVERTIVELSGDPMDLTIYDAKNAYSTAFDSPSMGRINTQMGAARRGFEECTKTQPKNEECHYYLGLRVRLDQGER